MRDGLRDVRGIEAARDNDAEGGRAREGPIERASGAAIELAGGSIEQQGLGMAAS